MKRTISIVAIALVAACGGGSGTTDGGAGDGGGGDGASGEGGNPNDVTQKGRIIDYTLKVPAADAIVTIVGGASTKSDAMGLYSLKLPKNKPSSFTLTGDLKLKLIEQEFVLSGDVDRGDTNLVSVTTQNLLKAFLAGYDAKLATLSVGVNKAGCASIDGVTVDLDPPQMGTKILYFQGGLPSTMLTSGLEGQLPTAIIYNIDASKPVRVKAMHPTCKMAAYPFTDPEKPTLSYTGNVSLEAGDATSYVRVWLQ